MLRSFERIVVGEKQEPLLICFQFEEEEVAMRVAVFSRCRSQS